MLSLLHKHGAFNVINLVSDARLNSEKVTSSSRCWLCSYNMRVRPRFWALEPYTRLKQAGQYYLWVSNSELVPLRLWLSHTWKKLLGLRGLKV